MTTVNVSPQLSLDANGNLVLGGSAPSGAATTDKLQVNGDAIIGAMRITKNGFNEPLLTGLSYGVNFKAMDVSDSSQAGTVYFYGGNSAGGYGGGVTFVGGSGGPGKAAGVITFSAIGKGVVTIDTETSRLYIATATSSSLTGKISAADAQFGTFTGAADAASNGYVTITDKNGATCKLMTRA